MSRKPPPFRRVVRSRPLSEQELERIYGEPERSPAPRFPPPEEPLPRAVVDREELHPLSYPPVAQPSSEADEYAAPAVRRRRTWPVVVLALAGAAGLLAYVIARQGDEVAHALGIAPVPLLPIEPPLSVDREPLELDPLQVKLELPMEESVPSGDQARSVAPAKRSTAPVREEQRQLEDPYPDLSQQELDDLKQNLDEQMGVRPRLPAAPAPREQRSLEAVPPRSDNPYLDPPDSEEQILREPGF
jgi:hypothetical protein